MNHGGKALLRFGSGSGVQSVVPSSGGSYAAYFDSALFC